MFKQIVGVLPDRVGVLFTEILTVDDLRLDLGAHLLHGNLTFEHIVDLIAVGYLSRVFYKYILCSCTAACRDREVHFCCFAVRDATGKLHIEVHADIAV